MLLTNTSTTLNAEWKKFVGAFIFLYLLTDMLATVGDIEICEHHSRAYRQSN